MTFFYLCLAMLLCVPSLLIVWPIMAQKNLPRAQRLWLSGFVSLWFVLLGLGLYYRIGVPYIVELTG
jgi:flagellar biosynthesis protein FliR